MTISCPIQEIRSVTTSSGADPPKTDLHARLSALFLSLDIRFPLLVSAVHFLIVQSAATIAYRYGTPTKSSGPYEGSIGAPRSMTGFWESFVGPLRLWDGLWYKQIAERFYQFGEANAAFWPLLPWVVRYGHRLTGLEYEVVGYLFVNACFLGALVVLYQLIRIDFDQHLARRTLWCLALFPTALFFSTVYTESPFLLFAALCLLGARTGNWIVAGCAGLLAALTRSQGAMLIAPMGILFLQQYRLEIRRWFPNALLAGMPILGPLFFAWRLDRLGQQFPRTNFTWRSFIDVQNQWYRTNAMPWKTFECAVQGCSLKLSVYGETKVWGVEGADWGWLTTLIRHPSWSLVTSNAWRAQASNSDTLELVLTLGFLGLAIVGLFKLPLWMSAFVFPPLLLPLFQPSIVHPLMSMPRFGIVLFPLFIVLALFLEDKWVRIPATCLCVAVLVLLTMQFSNWYWVS